MKTEMYEACAAKLYGLRIDKKKNPQQQTNKKYKKKKLNEIDSGPIHFKNFFFLSDQQ